MKLMVIGFSKAGTTSLTEALRSSGLEAVHWQDKQNRLVGKLIYNAVYKGLDPFAHLAGFDAVTQADACFPEHNINFWPNLDFAILRAIRRSHPSCLFVLNYRRPEAIADSIMGWRDLQARICNSDVPGLPRGVGSRREHLITWIENHFDACRSFFATDDRFIEVDIESPDVAERLGIALGVPIIGWKRVKPNPLRAALSG